MLRSRIVVLVAALIVVTGCAGGATDPPTDVTDTAATLRAHGTAGGKPTTYWFQYGPNTSYGTTTTHRDGGSGVRSRRRTPRDREISEEFGAGAGNRTRTAFGATGF